MISGIVLLLKKSKVKLVKLLMERNHTHTHENFQKPKTVSLKRHKQIKLDGQRQIDKKYRVR